MEFKDTLDNGDSVSITFVEKYVSFSMVAEEGYAAVCHIASKKDLYEIRDIINNALKQINYNESRHNY